MPDSVERHRRLLQPAEITTYLGQPHPKHGLAVDMAPPLPMWVAPPGLALPLRSDFGMSKTSSDVSSVPPSPSLDSLDTLPANTGSPSTVTSIGSVGHPHTCGKACKYARRKNGCRDGSNCLGCHLCQWHRGLESKLEECRGVGGFSGGMQGHPQACGKACNYFGRPTGCRNWTSCTDSHQCPWQRLVQAEVDGTLLRMKDGKVEEVFDGEAPATMLNLPSAVATLEGTSESSVLHDCCPSVGSNGCCPSVGSIGHPFHCAGWGCKYNKKARGCKDASLCLRCHLCPWRRQQPSIQDKFAIRVCSV